MDMDRQKQATWISGSKPTLEGAGVHLKRAFGYNEVPMLDPFLLLDHFGSNNPRDYLAGFPWHPHRGIETITYMLHGQTEHGDSMGNKGVIYPGYVQWMTAGSGIIHQEMPKPYKPDGHLLSGFQLWANLPASDKMMDPRYRDVHKDEIPEIEVEGGASVKVVAGTVDGTSGPVQDIVTNPEYLDVTLPAYAKFTREFPEDHKVFAFVFDGEGKFDGKNASKVGEETLLVFGDGDFIEVSASQKPVRFILVSGRPIGEPVAWYGPIVMNTDEELHVAFQEYENGTFIKHGSDPEA